MSNGDNLTMSGESPRSRWRPGRAAIIPLIGVAIMIGGAIAALLGGGDGAWVVAILGFFVVLTAFGF